MSYETEPSSDPHSFMADALPLPRGMLRSLRKARHRRKAIDSTGESLTGGQILLRSLILRRLLLREILSADEERIGILLPPTNGGLIVNAAVALTGRVAVNLNYSASNEVMNTCVQAAGLKHVLTSRKVVKKLDPKLDAKIICLEDLRPKLKMTDKLAGMLGAYALPWWVTDRMLDLEKVDMDDVVTIIFTSGSTGQPKGVKLTHRNIIHNIRAMEHVVRLNDDDVILGILPFFHAFGYTVTLWTPLTLGLGAAYHFNPLEAKQIGKLARQSGATILLSTPTFLRSFLKRVPPEDFATLEVVVVGAEKLPMPLSDAFEARFGVRPVEGYGATELAPLVSVNVPPARSTTDEIDLREGSIGQPVPGVSVRVVDPETGDPLGVDVEGMLEVSGPNMMQGYLDDDEKTAQVVHGNWYVTGDIARIDEQGFVHITGRQSRFSKIGGEMVPHLRVEEEIQQLLGGHDAEEQLAVVSAVPDERKGERLVVLHLPMETTPTAICEHLQSIGLPNLWIPSADSFMEIQSMPLLGSGKLDLKQMAKLALEHFG